MKRKKHIALLAFALLPLFAAGSGLYWLGWTNAGLQWVSARIAPALGDTLRYGKLEGRLSGPLTIHDLALDTERVALRLRELRIDWTPWRLLAGHLHVGTLEARELALTVSAGKEDEPDTPFRLPERLDLPFRITLADARLQDARLALPGAPSTLRIDSLTLAGSADDRHLQLDAVALRGPDLDITGRAALSARRPFAARAELRWRLHAGKGPDARGELQLTGDSDVLEWHATAAGPFTLRVDGTLAHPFTAPRWQAQLRLEDFRPSKLIADVPPFVLDASLALDGDFDTLNADGRLALRASGMDALGTISADLRAHLNADRMRLEALQLSAEKLPTRLHAKGELALAEPFAWQAEGGWQALAIPANGAAVPLSPRGEFTVSGDATGLRFDARAAAPDSEKLNLALHGETVWTATPAVALSANWTELRYAPGGVQLYSPQGRLQASGTADDYRLEAALDLLAQNLPAAAIELTAAGGLESLSVERLSMQWLEGRWQASGRLDWRDALAWRARLDAQAVNPGVLAPDFPGRVSARLEAAGTQGTRPSLTLNLHSLGGSLRERELNGAGKLAWQPAAGQLEVAALRLNLGKASFTAGGRLGGGQPDFSWTLDIPALADLHPDAAGSLAGSGRLAGTRAAPRLDLELRGRALAWRDYAVGEFRARAALAPDEHSTARLQLLGLHRPGLDFGSLRLAIAGTPQAHEIDAALSTPAGILQARARGGYTGRAWQGELLRASLQLPEGPPWSLAAPADLRLAVERQSLGRACWRQPPARLCAEAENGPAGWRAALSLSRLPLAGLAPWLPGGLDYRGRFDGSASARGGAQGLQARLELALDEGEISQQQEGERLSLLRFDRGKLQAELADNRLQSRLDFALSDGGELGARLALWPLLGDAPPAARRLEARFTARTGDFALVPILVPEIGSFQGQLNADLLFGGTLAAPTVRGRARFSEGRASLPRQGLRLSDVDLTLTGRGERLELTGSARSGPGTLQWRFALGREAGRWRGAGELRGDRFQAFNSPEAWVLVSPELGLSVDGRELRLDGRVLIPEARLTPRDVSGAVTASPDQVIVHADETQTTVVEESWRLHARVTTVFGAGVRFAGFGLSAGIRGEVTALEEPGRPTLGQGELRLENGEYEAYGTRLSIDTGKLIYNGVPITEPALDITAKRVVGDVTVGLNVRGTLREPRLSLFSSPPLRETEMLSYLILGRPVNEASTAEQQRLGSAATSLGLAAGGTLVARSIGRRLGIENVSIESAGDPEQAALVLGEYLTPRLYVSYGIGLFEAVNTVHLRYQISSKWTLEAESGEYSSADFLYTIETD